MHPDARDWPPARLGPQTRLLRQNPHTREIRLALPPGIRRGSGASALLQGPPAAHLLCSHLFSPFWLSADTTLAVPAAPMQARSTLARRAPVAHIYI